MKICTRCGIEKKLSEFHKNRNNKDKLVYWCKDCCKKYKKIYLSNPKNKIKNNKAIKQWLKLHSNEIKIYKEKNKDKIRKIKQKIYFKNKIKINKQHTIYCKKRYKNDINFKIVISLRNRLTKVIKKKSKSTLKLLGCSIEKLKNHLESRFKSGMNWSNYGLHGWHIDHIRPCSSFDLSKSEEQAKCFHYTNLQPLWAEENLKKGNKYE